MVVYHLYGQYEADYVGHTIQRLDVGIPQHVPLQYVGTKMVNIWACTGS